jgi:hypothetical protein
VNLNQMFTKFILGGKMNHFQSDSLRPGNIVEIKDFKPAFDGCLAVIEQVKDWGVIAVIIGPGNTGTVHYPLRLKLENICHVWHNKGKLNDSST